LKLRALWKLKFLSSSLLGITIRLTDSGPIRFCTDGCKVVFSHAVLPKSDLEYFQVRFQIIHAVDPSGTQNQSNINILVRITDT
jgi:hypothetical protein